MNYKRFLISTALVFVFILIFDWVFHGILLMDMYKDTVHLWRPGSERMNFFPLLLLFKIILAAVLTYIFTCHYEGKGIKEGICYGLCIGVLMGVLAARMYCYMPIPFVLAAAWFVGGVSVGLGSGIIMSLTYKTE